MAENNEIQTLKNTQSLKNLSDITAANHKVRLDAMAINHKEQLELTATGNKEKLALSKEQLVLSNVANEAQVKLGMERTEAIVLLGGALKANGLIAEKTEKEVKAGNDSAKKAKKANEKDIPHFGLLGELQLTFLQEIRFGIDQEFKAATKYRKDQKTSRKKAALAKLKEMKETKKFRIVSALKKIEETKDRLKALPKKGFTKAFNGIKKGVTSLWDALKKVLKGALLIALMVGLGKFLESETFKKLLASLESGEFFDNLMTWWDDTKERVSGFVDGIKAFGVTIGLVIAALLALKVFKLGKALAGLVGIGAKVGSKVAAKAGTKVAAKTAAKAGTKLAIKGVAKTGVMSAAQKTATAVAAKKAVAVVGVKSVGKGLAKSALKKIPVLGALFGAGFAISRLMKGDKVGAGMELASGLAAIIPGFGTAASVGIDAALIARDMNKAKADTLAKPVEDKTKKLTDAQREVNQADKANGGTVIVNAPANSNTTNNQTSQVMENSMPEVARPNNFGEPAFA